MKPDLSTISIDLRGTPCPVNYVRCTLALEELSMNDCLDVYLDKGEPEEMVVHGLRNQGHYVKMINEGSTWVRLMVVRSAG